MLIDKPRALLGNEVKFIPYTLVKQIVSLYCKKLAGPVCMDFGNHKTKTGENCQSDFISHLIQRPGFKWTIDHSSKEQNPMADVGK